MKPKIPEYECTGVVSQKELKAVLPPTKRLQKGPVAVIECFQRIPCDPCVDACKRGAITIEGSLIELPEVDFEKCNGCAVCIAKCPGLAIFVVDAKKSTISLPHEFLPKPPKGEIVYGLNRKGEIVCDARTIKVLDKKKQDHCAVITVEVPPKYLNEVRNIRLKQA